MIMKKALLFAAVAIMAAAGNFAAYANITLEDVSGKATVKAQSPGSITPSADGESYYQMKDGTTIVKVSFKTGKEETVFDTNTARDCDVEHWDGFRFSDDESKILLHTNVQMVYRRSFRADYYVYEIRHNRVTKLTPEGGEMIATLSPNGRMVAYVKDNNVRLKKLDYNTDIAVTTDGEANKVINAATDWVYEEEFMQTNTFAWSPTDANGENLILAFVRFDESQVPVYHMQMYKGAAQPMPEYEFYPGSFDYKYPTAGQENSVVSVVSYDIDNKKLKTMNIPTKRDDYIPTIAFGPDPSQLLVTTLNRTQNEWSIYSVNPRSAVSKKIFEEQSETWIAEQSVIGTVYNSDNFIVMSERSGFMHLYQYSYAGQLTRQLTNGNWEVTNYYGYNPTTKCHYFNSTIISPLDRTITKVDAKGVITPMSNNEGWYGADFSSDCSYFIQSYNSPTTPSQYTVCNAAGKTVRELIKNDELAAKYLDGSVPTREFFTMESDGVTLNGFIIKPSNFNPSKKYPVIMAQYSGPESQEVSHKWMFDWRNYFATQGFVVACVDGRGTGYRGVDFKKCVYMKLGVYETIDQIAAARHIASLPYVDASRIAIWGWSYGGYEALMALTDPMSPFCCGIAIAPVTDWQLYDTVYTERYMRTPQENALGYSSCPLTRHKNLKAPTLIMHGTADDNVHITNSYQFAANLIEEGNTSLDMLVFSNMNHSIYYGNGRLMVYKKCLDFFNRNMKK